MCKDRRSVHRVRAAQAEALPLRVPLHAQDWQRCVRYCLNDAVGGYLYRLQIPPQMAEGVGFEPTDGFWPSNDFESFSL